MTPLDSYTIATVPPTSRAEALRFLLDSSGGEVGESGELLIWATRAGSIAGVAWAQPTSPKTATLAVPRIASGVPGRLRERLLTHLEAEIMAHESLRYAQVLLDDDDRLNRSLLQTAGYVPRHHVAFFMAVPSPVETSSDVSIHLADSGEREKVIARLNQAFANVDNQSTALDWSYDELFLTPSDDCYFVQYQHKTVGALVINRVRHNNSTVDIRYLGIDSDQRGKGFAQATMRWVRRWASTAGEITTAAVETNNKAAVRAYRSAGFHGWRCCEVWVRDLG